MVLGLPTHQIALDEAIDITIQDIFRIALFHTSSVIFDEPIGVKNIGAYLIPPGNFLFAFVNLLHLLCPFAHLQFIEACPENLHSGGPVFVLRAFILTLDYDPGGEMGDPDGGIGLIDMLSSGPAGPKSVYPDVSVINVNNHIVRRFRVYKYRRKRGMPPFACIKRRDPHETVDPCLGLEIAVGVLPFDNNGYILNTRLFSREDIDYLGDKTSALSPPQVHAQQHLGPILGLSAAGSGIDADNDVPTVVIVGEHAFQFEGTEPLFSFGQSFDGLCRLSPILYLGDLQEDLNLFQLPCKVFPRIDDPEQISLFLQDLLGLLRILPKTGRSFLFLDFLYLLFFLLEVKDTPADSPCVLCGLDISFSVPP